MDRETKIKKIIEGYKSGKYNNDPEFIENFNVLIEAGVIDKGVLEESTTEISEQQKLIPELQEVTREPFDPDPTKENMQKALNIASKVAPYAGMAFNLTPAGIARSAALTGGSRFIEGKTEGESTIDALKNAGISAVIDSAIGAAGKGVGRVIGSKPISEKLGQIGEFFSSVPQESVTKAIQDPSILTKTESFEDVGKSARKALQKQMEGVGEREVAEQALLGKGSEFIKENILPFTWLKEYDVLLKNIGKQEKELKTILGKQKKYKPSERAQVQKFIKDIKSDNTPSGLNEIIGRIDEKIKWNAKNEPTPRVEKVLKKIRENISSSLKKKFPEYEKSRAETTEVLSNVKNLIGKQLTDPKRDPSAYFKKQPQPQIQEALEELDRLSPSARILDRAKNIRIQDQYSKMFPGQGGGSGGAQGAGNIARMIMSGAGISRGMNMGGPEGAILAALTLASQSPLFHKKVIQSSPVLPKALGKVFARQQTPIQRAADGSYTEESKQDLRRNR